MKFSFINLSIDPILTVDDKISFDVGGASVGHRGYVIRHRGCVNCFRKLR